MRTVRLKACDFNPQTVTGMHKLPLCICAVARGCINPLPVSLRRSGSFKLLALIFSLSFALSLAANAQGGWEAPVTAWSGTWFLRPIVTPGGIKPPGSLLLYWQRASCDKNGIVMGYPKVAIYNADPGITVKNVWVTAVGIDCDGKQGKGIYKADQLGPYDKKADNLWDKCSFKMISKVIAVHFDYDINKLHYYVEYDQERGINSIKINGIDQDEWLKQQQQNAQDLKRQVADAKKKFDNIVIAYNQQLNNLRNAQTKSSFNNALGNWQRRFNAAEQQAQQYLTITDKDKVPPQIDLLNEITGKLNTNLSELNAAVEKEKQVQGSAKPTSPNGVQGVNTGSNNNQSRSPQQTNGNAQSNQSAYTTTNNSNARAAQSQVYQQQADAYLNAANNSSDAIQQSMNLNIAKANATAAGNTYQAQQIQQQQNQAQQANQQAMANSLGDLASATMGYFEQKQRNKELDRQQELEYQQYRREQEAQAAAAQRAAQQEQARRNAALQAERQAALERQWNTDKEALGNYLTHKTSSTIPDNKKEAFFIVYERLHPSGTSYSVVKMRTYAIEKYSDGTWMPILDILNKLKCTEAFNLDHTKLGIGFFASKQETLQFIENIKGYFKERVTTDMSFIIVNQSLQSAPQKDNFWNQ